MFFFCPNRILIAVMPREKDPFRKYVAIQNDDKSMWKCIFCKKRFRGGATRIKAHLGGVRGCGILGCEGVNVDVRAEARKALMPKKVTGSSVQGPSEERIEGNFGAALTSTSDPPYVEGGANLQSAQGVPSFPLDGATSYSSASPPPNSFFTNLPSDRVSFFNKSLELETSNAQQNPSAPLPSQNHQLLDNTFQFPEHIIDTMGPSRSEGPMDISSLTATHVHSHVSEGGASIFGSSSSQDLNEGAPMGSHPNKGDNFEECRVLKRKLKLLHSKEANIRGELEIAASRFQKKPRMEVINWLAHAEKCRNDFHSDEVASEDCYQQVDILLQEAKDLMRQGLCEERKLLERKMVGKAFQRNTVKILDYLVGNRVSRLGIYGMGGVGKTTIMVHIHNILLEKANYGNVLWITVSSGFNAEKLQDCIWKELGLGRLLENDVKKRAAMLSGCLMKRGKSTIILDDVWECFDLEEVGIPVRADALKLVLTTRSFDICCQMHCQETIRIEPLSQEEAESLFLEEIGSKAALNMEIEAVVKSIVRKCAGLPLGVITMAQSMRGVTDVFEWKDFLVKLRESDMGPTERKMKLLKVLELSYRGLDDYEVQQCFLSCALYPEDELIDKFELIELFIDQGFFGGLNTREIQYDRGLTVLNKLEKVCLLEDHGSKIKMHNLIRDMALHIMSATSIVKAGKGLTSVPPDECWTDALEKVSLMENDIREFPLSMSPNCPKLSTCLLNRSLSKDVVIPDSFFEQLWGLKVLNLSGCELTELPNSISDLVNLKALLLRECWELRRIPYLGKLKSLRKLDICHCSHLEALESLEMLVNLRYLDLTYTCIERLPKGTLGGLLNLQHLKVKVVNGEDITKLGALETLECYFEDVDDFNKCVRVLKLSNNPCNYELKVDKEELKFYVKIINYAKFGNCERSVNIRKWSHAIVSRGVERTGTCILIPQDVQKLAWKECDGTANLFGMGPLEFLELLDIDVWKNLRVLYGGQDKEITNIHDSPALIPTPPFFPNLRVLKISRCPKLKYLFGHGSNLLHLQEIRISHCEEMVGITAAFTSPPPHTDPAFPSLTKIEVSGCNIMKRVVESWWLSHFPNLKHILVCGCENMEEIIGGPPLFMPVEGISLESVAVQFCNNMRRLFPHEWLDHLQNLQSIDLYCCKGMVEMISGVGQGQEGSIMTPVENMPSSLQPSISLPKLKCFYVNDLPQLKSICEVPITCNSMERLKVYMCPELNRIPLQLRLCDIEDLPYIEVEDEEKLKTLIWDHPNAQAILPPHLLSGDSTCVLQGRRSHK